jgi:hypothetical protein
MKVPNPALAVAGWRDRIFELDWHGLHRRLACGACPTASGSSAQAWRGGGVFLPFVEWAGFCYL